MTLQLPHFISNATQYWQLIQFNISPNYEVHATTGSGKLLQKSWMKNVIVRAYKLSPN